MSTPAVRDRSEYCLGGAWQPATGDRMLEVVDPSTEKVVAQIREVSPQDVDLAVRAARAALEDGPWSEFTPDQRATALELIADGLEQRASEVAEAVTTEVGMPSPAASASVTRAIGMLRYYAGEAREFAFRTDRVRADGATTRILRRPVGVAALITPWNGPLGSAALKLGPALAAGCTAVLKVAPETPLSGFILAEVVADLVAAGSLPHGVLSVLTADREISQTLVEHSEVDKISFTGSTAAGRQIMAIAAQRIARVTLELGGKSAAIVTDDVPLDTVLRSLVMGGCGNTGQMCFALTRVLVSRRRYDEVVDALAAALSALRVGDPRESGTVLGPLATRRQRERVEEYIAAGRASGARLVTGGGRPPGLPRGFYIEPTLFADVDNGMRISREEIFGPVISVVPYRDIDDAVAIANDTMYGLSGSVYAKDAEAGYEIARRIRTGTCSVNGAVFDTTVPFGGFKQSGLGREGGPEGIEGFLETTSIHMPG